MVKLLINQLSWDDNNQEAYFLLRSMSLGDTFLRKAKKGKNGTDLFSRFAGFLNGWIYVGFTLEFGYDYRI